MAYIYLLNLYDEIEKRRQNLERQTNSINANKHQIEGRKDLLNEFQQYLSDNLNDKLPRRLRKQFAQKQVDVTGLTD